MFAGCRGGGGEGGGSGPASALQDLGVSTLGIRVSDSQIRSFGAQVQKSWPACCAAKESQRGVSQETSKAHEHHGTLARICGILYRVAYVDQETNQALFSGSASKAFCGFVLRASMATSI